MKRDHTRKITSAAILAAVSTVLMFFSFGVPFAPSYLKIDFSDFPALIASYSLGPVYGVAVSLVKNAINVFFSTTGGVGELSNFLLSAAFVFSAGIIYRLDKTRKNALVGAVYGLLFMSVLSFFTNSYLVYPAYINIAGFPEQGIIGAASAIVPSVDSIGDVILVFNLPFTFVKGLLNAILTFVLYKRLSPIIKTGKLR